MESFVGGESESMGSLLLPPFAQQMADRSRAGKNSTRRTKNVMILDGFYSTGLDSTETCFKSEISY